MTDPEDSLAEAAGSAQASGLLDAQGEGAPPVCEGKDTVAAPRQAGPWWPRSLDQPLTATVVPTFLRRFRTRVRWLLFARCVSRHRGNGRRGKKKKSRHHRAYAAVGEDRDDDDNEITR